MCNALRFLFGSLESPLIKLAFSLHPRALKPAYSFLIKVFFARRLKQNNNRPPHHTRIVIAGFVSIDFITSVLLEVSSQAVGQIARRHRKSLAQASRLAKGCSSLRRKTIQLYRSKFGDVHWPIVWGLAILWVIGTSQGHTYQRAPPIRLVQHCWGYVWSV